VIRLGHEAGKRRPPCVAMPRTNNRARWPAGEQGSTVESFSRQRGHSWVHPSRAQRLELLHGPLLRGFLSYSAAALRMRDATGALTLNHAQPAGCHRQSTLPWCENVDGVEGARRRSTAGVTRIKARGRRFKPRGSACEWLPDGSGVTLTVFPAGNGGWSRSRLSWSPPAALQLLDVASTGN